MKKMLWMLAAAASLAACHNRGEDDMGAAPAKGDTTAVTNDTTTGRFDTTTTAQPTDTAMTPTVPTDTTSAAPVPTTPDTSSMGQDSGMSADTSANPSSGAPTDSTQSPQ